MAIYVISCKPGLRPSIAYVLERQDRKIVITTFNECMHSQCFGSVYSGSKNVTRPENLILSQRIQDISVLNENWTDLSIDLEIAPFQYIGVLHIFGTDDVITDTVATFVTLCVWMKNSSSRAQNYTVFRKRLQWQ